MLAAAGDDRIIVIIPIIIKSIEPLQPSESKLARRPTAKIGKWPGVEGETGVAPPEVRLMHPSGVTRAVSLPPRPLPSGERHRPSERERAHAGEQGPMCGRLVLYEY